MEIGRNDFGIAVRSAFLTKGTKQRFSLIALIITSIILIFIENIESKPLNYARSFIKDTVYKGSQVVSFPLKGLSNITHITKNHFNLYDNYKELKIEHNKLKESISKSDYLELENNQLRKLIEEQVSSKSNLISARIMLDKQSPYLESFVINIGSNKGIKNSMAVLSGTNFIGRTVDVNFFSSRVLLISDLNSKIPAIIEPSANHTILSGHGKNEITLEYLPKNYDVNDGDKVYTSGKEGIFMPGIPIGEVMIKNGIPTVSLFSNLNQITFINVMIDGNKATK
jgi:rod shape-determining protein MreC